MSISVALSHRTTYEYDRPVNLAPHVVRLRPAPHSRTPIKSYSLRIEPEDHFINWQQDAYANWSARLVFNKPTQKFSVTVDLVADMVAINPFDFFIEESCEQVPFAYTNEQLKDLRPYLRKVGRGDTFRSFVEEAPAQSGTTNDWLVAVNSFLANRIDYTIRMEPGVQRPSVTIRKALGSCRDSAWLMVALLRELGYAARFVSGYLIQLTADQKPIEGPAGPEDDFTDLHAWCEIYLPGAGWIGMDPTSGLFAGEGHIPLAATPEPTSAAAITGAHEFAEVSFSFDMSVKRIDEPPRVTRPLSPEQWAEIDRAGQAIDQKLEAQDMRLTMGGEPTFVSAIDRDGEEWFTAAVGPTKRTYADSLVRRLRERFAPHGVLHHGQGKWYPGEPLPRWAYSLIWRGDGLPLWSNADLLAKENTGSATYETAEEFSEKLLEALDLGDEAVAHPLYEDPLHFMGKEAMLPDNVSVKDSQLEDPQERARMVRMLNNGLSNPVSYVIPIQLAQAKASSRRRFRWTSDVWGTRRDKLFLMPGDSPAGYRLPLNSLDKSEEFKQYFRDTMLRRKRALPARRAVRRNDEPENGADENQVLDTPVFGTGYGQPTAANPTRQVRQQRGNAAPGPAQDYDEDVWLRDVESSDDWLMGEHSFWVEGMPVRTALAVEPRDGILHVFMPPTGSSDEYLDLVEAVEETAASMDLPVRIEGYEPPNDGNINIIRVTPDPGVIEVNIHPAKSWQSLKEINEALYEEARQCGLDSFTFMVDGRLTGSGGGNHIVVGGATPADSPFLRRPDLIGSLIRYWQRHPSLSYLFSGTFIGPTSQAPRFDEGLPDKVYEMEIALNELTRIQESGQSFPWLSDRILRHLLTDLTGNTHRAEICIDKMYSPDSPTGRLGLVEFRGFEMPPHWQMSMAQSLVMRGLLAWFWDTPYEEPLEHWGQTLHDKFLLPHHCRADFNSVLDDLSSAHGFAFRPDWYDAQYEMRFGEVGHTHVEGLKLTLRNGIEPWLVLGEEATGGGTSRYVDSSLERVELKIEGDLGERFVITCNQVEVPLEKVGPDTYVAGIRFRSWQPWSSLHPTIPAHAPLVFDVYDRISGRSVGGLKYLVAHEGGRAHETRPVNELEAEGRRRVRFQEGQHTPFRFDPIKPRANAWNSATLDMRFI
ncbi:transglutaminase family protein [Octadecabacter sp. 1_MG-2023]|uniref:transglutaminase family protein n=1 Tax=unclassified Octadecabacter TaxID=196158 RepID=UPI001C0A5196|nr:transglutaminase family protein [Octadecabacter sp. 1_MG-2023]MBU2994397.1 transglutaminase family protein [Octadecabacter sp. B2R22]MDO6734312.1 transglutaminase family protein [Octadecabacter sp. 1_MG-2023]